MSNTVSCTPSLFFSRFLIELLLFLIQNVCFLHYHRNDLVSVLSCKRNSNKSICFTLSLLNCSLNPSSAHSAPNFYFDVYRLLLMDHLTTWISMPLGILYLGWLHHCFNLLMFSFWEFVDFLSVFYSSLYYSFEKGWHCTSFIALYCTMLPVKL